jgi:hypothetical protein
MEFQLFNVGKKHGNWWIDFAVVKWAQWEPGIFRISYNHGKWEYDVLGWGELSHWWRQR